MATFKEKREKIEKLVLDTVKILDNKKMENYKRYQILFKTMSDKDFEKWASNIGNELDNTITMYQLPYEEMKISQIKSAANYLKIPLEEYIYYRHTNPDGIRSKIPVPVGYVHIKRVQQLLSKKNRYAFDNEEVSLKDGQVKSDSKVASLSEPETLSLAAINANKAIEEFLGPRSDNQEKKNEMYKNIARDGFVALEDLEENIETSTTLNTINTYLLGSGIVSDLVTSGLKTLYTVDNEINTKR